MMIPDIRFKKILDSYGILWPLWSGTWSSRHLGKIEMSPTRALSPEKSISKIPSRGHLTETELTSREDRDEVSFETLTTQPSASREDREESNSGTTSCEEISPREHLGTSSVWTLAEPTTHAVPPEPEVIPTEQQSYKRGSNHLLSGMLVLRITLRTYLFESPIWLECRREDYGNTPHRFRLCAGSPELGPGEEVVHRQRWLSFW